MTPLLRSVERGRSAVGRLLIVAVFAFLAACRPVAGEAGQVGGTGESITRYQAGSGDLSVDVTLRVDRGEVGFVVIDPNAQVRYQSAILSAGSNYGDVLRFTGAAGEWRIVFKLEDAQATYEIEWRS